jgi:putative transposase
MKKSRYTEEQIAFALKQAETGTPIAEVIRGMGISEQTFYRWKKVYGELGVGELRRAKQLEDENRRYCQDYWRRVATRYDKTKESYLGFVSIASALLWIPFVHETYHYFGRSVILGIPCGGDA